MNIKPIRNDRDYQAALEAISALIEADPNPKPGTSIGDEVDVLATLVQAYEQEHFPLDLPDPVEAIKFRMDQAGLTPKDLQPMIGRLNRVYEVLNRKRALTAAMVWKLHTQLGIPARSLITPSKASATKQFSAPAPH